MFQTILVATDGSDHARKAVQAATDLASKYGSTLVVTQVLSEQSEVPEGLMHMAEIEHLIDPRHDTYVESPTSMAPTVQISDSGSRVRKVLQAVGERLTDDARKIAKETGVRDVKTFVDEGDPPEHPARHPHGRAGVALTLIIVSFVVGFGHARSSGVCIGHPCTLH